MVKLAEQCVILVRQCHSREPYFRRQRVLTALFKDWRKVKSVLKEGTLCFDKEEKVLLGEKFQKKVNETIKSKKKTKGLSKEYITKPTPARSRQPFRQRPQPNSLGRGHHSYQSQGFMPIDGPIKFYFREGRGKSELQPPWRTFMQYKFETKNTRPSKFKQQQKCSPICQNTFQGDINFCSARKVKILSEKLGKSYRPSKNPKHSAGLIYRFLETPYQSKKNNTGKIKP